MAGLPKDKTLVSSAFLLNLFDKRKGVIKMRNFVSFTDDVFENFIVGAFVTLTILLMVMFLVRYL
jgi:hypothetical protein